MGLSNGLREEEIRNVYYMLWDIVGSRRVLMRESYLRLPPEELINVVASPLLMK